MSTKLVEGLLSLSYSWYRNVKYCTQDFPSFSEYMHQFTRGKYMDAMSDLHLLIYLAACDMLPIKVGLLPADLPGYL